MSISLRSLSLLSRTADSATVDFGEGLTVIHGATDTGKSFIFNAIDFMLGAQNLRHVQELDDYDTVMLALRADEAYWTLARSVSGGRFTLFEGSHTTLPAELGTQLAPRHRGDREDNVSAWLLRQTGIGFRQVRRNAQNDTVALSFRDVERLCAVDEIVAISTDSPIESGQYVNRTKERSAFRVLLENTDDSSLVVQQTQDQETRSTRSQLEALGRLLGQLQSDVGDLAARTETEAALNRLRQVRDTDMAGMSDITAELEALNDQLDAVTGDVRATADRAQERQLTVTRFELLADAYTSDLDRLAAVEEVGSLLGFLGGDECPFCGAPSTEWRHSEIEAANLHEVVQAERDRIRLLQARLSVTLESMREEVTSDARQVQALEDQANSLREEHARVRGRGDERLASLRQLATRETELVQRLAKWEQFDSIVEFRDELESRLVADTETVVPVALPSVDEFTDTVSRVLEAWNVPGSHRVSFDLRSWDLVVDGRPRAERGKGMRALLRAAFTVGFAQFCLESERPHPGYVILDSPLVTYRDPETEGVNANRPTTEGPGEEGEDFVNQSVADAFYRYLNDEFLGQAIVIENTVPPDGLDGVVAHNFTRSAVGRYGFFPAS